MKSEIGFGIIGCGAISKWHAEGVSTLEGAKLVGVFDAYRSSAEKLAEEYSCRVFESIDDMLSSEEIDAVSICVPSGLHAEIGIRAAKCGKHILIEKPMAITKEQCDNMMLAASENKVKCAVISQMRFTKAVQETKAAIDSGALGRIVLGDVYMKYYRSPEYYSSSNWRGTYAMDGGGALMNQGIHGVDLLLYLAGDIKAVCASCKTLERKIEVEDAANVLVEFNSGAMGVIQGTTCVNPGYPRIIEINGTEGSIMLKEDIVERWDIGDKNIPVTSEGLVYSFREPTAFTTANHILQMKDFMEAIWENRRPLVDFAEGRKAVDVILAAYESSRTGEWVYLGNH